MAGPFKEQASATSRRVTPQDEHVHQGAILFLPRKTTIDQKYGKNHVRNVVDKEVDKKQRKDCVQKEFGTAAPGAYLHPILVLSRPDESTIEFITLRSYSSTALEDKWPLFIRKHLKRRLGDLYTPREIVEQHLSIFPAHHPLYTMEGDQDYKALKLLDNLEMYVKSHVSVIPILRMDWRASERWFRKDEPRETIKHRRLDAPSIRSVLRLAKEKAGYVPGGQYTDPAGSWTQVTRRR